MTIHGKITRGQFKGKNISVNFGHCPQETVVRMNGKKIDNCKSILIYADANELNFHIELNIRET